MLISNTAFLEKRFLKLPRSLNCTRGHYAPMLLSNAVATDGKESQVIGHHDHLTANKQHDVAFPYELLERLRKLNFRIDRHFEEQRMRMNDKYVHGCVQATWA